MNKSEIFIPIKEYNGVFLIGNKGTVLSNARNKQRILSSHIHKIGYLQLRLWLNGIGKSFLIHRLVAIHFIPNPNKLPEVNHKNGIKTDNRVENLEWCNRSHNILHSYHVLNNPPPRTWLGKKGGDHNMAKRVYQIDKNTLKVINHFPSIIEASESTGVHRSHIGEVAKGMGIRKTAGGFKWSFNPHD